MARWMVRIGSALGVIGLLCCFTPLLPFVLGGLGATGLLSTLYTDAVLFPVVGAGLALAGLGLWLQRRAR